MAQEEDMLEVEVRPARRRVLENGETLDAERLVEIVFESIIETLNHGEKIELRGFGSFRVRERGARRGRGARAPERVYRS